MSCFRRSPSAYSSFREIPWQMLILPSVFFRVLPWQMLPLLLILPSVANASASAFQYQRIYIRRSIGIKETIPDASGSERHLFI